MHAWLANEFLLPLALLLAAPATWIIAWLIWTECAAHRQHQHAGRA